MTSDAEAAYRSTVARLIESSGDITETKMMGMPALKRAGKLFGGFCDDALVVKLGKKRADELIAAGQGGPFDPSSRGRPMKDWVAVPLPADRWHDLAAEASTSS